MSLCHSISFIVLINIMSNDRSDSNSIEPKLTAYVETYAAVRGTSGPFIDFAPDTSMPDKSDALGGVRVIVHDPTMDTASEKTSDSTNPRKTKHRENIPDRFDLFGDEGDEATFEMFGQFLQSGMSWSQYYQKRRDEDAFRITRSGSKYDGRRTLPRNVEGERCQDAKRLDTDTGDMQQIAVEQSGVARS